MPRCWIATLALSAGACVTYVVLASVDAFDGWTQPTRQNLQKLGLMPSGASSCPLQSFTPRRLQCIRTVCVVRAGSSYFPVTVGLGIAALPRLSRLACLASHPR